MDQRIEAGHSNIGSGLRGDHLIDRPQPMPIGPPTDPAPTGGPRVASFRAG
jgi:hypothetical protein